MSNTSFNIQEFIDSGMLELYVAGVLSEQENLEIHNIIEEHKEVKEYVISLEKDIAKFTGLYSPSSFSLESTDITKNSANETKVIQMPQAKKNWTTYTGWAASVILALGLTYNFFQNESLKNKVVDINNEKEVIQEKLNQSESLLNIIRNKDVVEIPLNAQNNFNAYAKIYWNKSTQDVHLDVKGLPEPPEGKVYQVWSLTLDPLTPTSLGTLDGFVNNESKIFTIKNPNESQAFGITLEPKGGSETPTMNQLHTLGVVKV
ncbi:anti-sigma factor [Pseudofulvibacter geojedonensis]|uniref:Anti-sigma factor domain-containing protein n=1 Tax=Pseudofulvibacter geojedonensis TaxID=1123758 RepID=A0ABW3I0V1_9FLAO